MFICWSVGVFTAEGCSRCVARLENDMQLREQFLLPGRAPCPRPSLWTGAGISVPPASGAASPSRRMSSQLRTPGRLLAGVAVSSRAAVAVSDLDARAARPHANKALACLPVTRLTVTGWDYGPFMCLFSSFQPCVQRTAIGGWTRGNLELKFDVLGEEWCR